MPRPQEGNVLLSLGTGRGQWVGAERPREMEWKEAAKAKGREDVRVYQGLEQGLVWSELH